MTFESKEDKDKVEKKPPKLVVDTKVGDGAGHEKPEALQTNNKPGKLSDKEKRTLILCIVAS